MSTSMVFYPPLGSNCDDRLSPFHNLDCGHVVHTVKYTFKGKTACGPGCIRSVFLQKPNLPIISFKNTSSLPFVCPECVEDCVRHDYDSMLRKHRAEGGRLADDKEANVKLWTYKEILGMAGPGESGFIGMRMCEGRFGGVFKLRHVAKWQALIASSEEAIISGWSGNAQHTVAETGGFTFCDMRDSQAMSTRPSSGDVEIDPEDASHVALLRARYRDQAVRKLQHSDELDQLAEQLGDAKVSAGEEDVEMMDLATDLEGL
jgi:hypothetical protein